MDAYSTYLAKSSGSQQGKSKCIWYNLCYLRTHRPFGKKDKSYKNGDKKGFSWRQFFLLIHYYLWHSCKQISNSS